MSTAQRNQANSVDCDSPKYSRTDIDDVSSLPPRMPKAVPAKPRRPSMKSLPVREPSNSSSKVGSKKRKPRPSSIVTAANSRLQSNTSHNKTTPVTVPDASNLPTLPPPPPPLPPITPPSTPSAHIPVSSDSKRKGLRHFAIRVCRKVEQKGQTTYNEVADELVAEERSFRAHASISSTSLQNELNDSNSACGSTSPVDEKNIRRRVYDSLNVLMAMEVIAKDRKLISWQGLDIAQCVPPIAVEEDRVKMAIEEKRRDIQEKVEHLKELKDQYARVKALVKRRQEEEELLFRTTKGSMVAQFSDFDHNIDDIDDTQRLSPPFVVIRAPCESDINVTMDEAHEEVNFNFSSTFSIFDDREILRRMRLLPESTQTQNSSVS